MSHVSRRRTPELPTGTTGRQTGTTGRPVVRLRLSEAFGQTSADTTLRVIDPSGELLTTVPRISTGEISRFKAYGTKHPRT
jgi:hypothetical protein